MAIKPTISDILKAKQHEPTSYVSDETHSQNDGANGDDVLEAMEGEESPDTSMNELYKTLLTNEDMILIIDRGDEELLRKGLTTVKYKYNKKDKAEGRTPDGRSLEFTHKPFTAAELEEMDEVEGKVKVQVWLKARASIRVHKIILTDKEF